MSKTKSLCGVADLLADITGVDVDRIRAKFGIPLKHPKCQVCGEYLAKDGLCHHAHYILLICDACGVAFRRKERVILSVAKRNPEGYQHQFCSRICFGSWLGKNYGWGAHKGGLVK